MSVAQREYWLRLLEQVGGNVSTAARVSGVNRTDVHKHLQRLGVPKGYGRPQERAPSLAERVVERYRMAS